MSLLSQFYSFEGIAVTLAIAYLVLAARENIICWYCALISTMIYTLLFWNVSLLMESMLNVYYMIMAIYGWQQWRYGGREHKGLSIRTLSAKNHAAIIGLILLLTVISGYLLSRYTSAAWPYIDSLTTWASIITTFMVARKILENWIYWFVIDSISIPIYIERGLLPTAMLFAIYLVIVVYGYFSWRQRLSTQHDFVANTA